MWRTVAVAAPGRRLDELHEQDGDVVRVEDAAHGAQRQTAAANTQCVIAMQ